MMKNIFLLVSTFLIINTSCKENKTSNENMNAGVIEIRNQDYTIDLGHADIEVYFTLDRKKMHGHYIVIDNSVLKEEFYLKEGLLHGAHKHYFPNKTLAINTMYKNGKKHGLSTSYYNSVS